MIKDLLKWVAPGVVTVLGGTTAALSMAAPAMTDTIDSQSRALLQSTGLEWADVAVVGRDVTVSGTVENPDLRRKAETLLVGALGVASVKSAVTIAPLADPFVLDVKVQDGAVSLYGSVPNETVRQRLTALPQVASASLVVRSGQTGAGSWERALDYALAQAGFAGQGHFTLSGLTLDVEAQARSQSAFGAMQVALADPPEGVALGSVVIDPVSVSPYTWSADFDGGELTVAGHVPNEALPALYRQAAPAGLPVATGLALASGAPEGFAETSQRLLQQLARLETGEASIADGVSRLSGVAPSMEVAQAVSQALDGTGSIVELAPPLVLDYWASVTRQQGGVLVFDGYAPDEATRTAFSEVAGADVNFLNLGGGAPVGYRAAMDLGLELLTRMSEGRVALSGTEFSVSGMAATPADFRAIRAALAEQLPAGITLARSEVEPPRADTYTFAATKGADGRVVLAGLLPDPEIEQRLVMQAGPSALSEIDYASGEPSGFEAAADQALQFLSWLESGEVRFDGTGWSITGTPATTIDQGAIETEFAVERLAQSGWSLDLAAPPLAAAPPPEPVPPTQEAAATPEPSPTEPEPAATLAQCRERLAELSSHNAILFQSGAAIIAASATAELDAFAGALALCPQSAVEVEGHTDSDGDDEQNLALSVARAEAVVSALIERGVEAERLYAVGYGASQPVADNATAEGKRQNRRIVIALRDAAD